MVLVKMHKAFVLFGRNSPHGSFDTKGLDGELGGPCPILFSAMIRNSYSLSSMRSVTVRVSSVMRSLEAFIHLALEVKRRSTVYPRMGEPPSSVGGFHVTVVWSLKTSVTSGASGAPGTPVK